VRNDGAATRSRNDEIGPAAFERIAVIGGGAWGTAIALTAVRAGRRATLWARETSVVDAINSERRNPFLPSIELPRELAVTSDVAAAVRGAHLVALVTPSQFLRGTARRVEAVLAPRVPVLICSKGVEAYTGLLMSQVVAAEMPGRPQAVLSGPTFAQEVASDVPTAATVAAPRAEGDLSADHLAARIAVTFATPAFRPYLSDDVAGVEIGGAVKNVLAIACGIAAGRGLGSNTRAAIITRGLAEITRLAAAVGARRETMSGLAGAGDLLLTCSSEQSRNFSYGKALGEGRLPQLSEDGPVVEGVANAASVAQLARDVGVEMPICAAVDAVIRGEPIDEAMTRLMQADLRAEPPSLEHLRIPHPAVTA
jgi:glycerol-3-phosphate dehydrogenase (NAD(P)+)